jgi:hypothetical protein
MQDPLDNDMMLKTFLMLHRMSNRMEKAIRIQEHTAVLTARSNDLLDQGSANIQEEIDRHKIAEARLLADLKRLTERVAALEAKLEMQNHGDAAKRANTDSDF